MALAASLAPCNLQPFTYRRMRLWSFSDLSLIINGVLFDQAEKREIMQIPRLLARIIIICGCSHPSLLHLVIHRKDQDFALAEPVGHL